MIIDLVKYPVVTAKSTFFIERHQYTFDVDLKLNKFQIKELIQNLFKVHVLAVNTHRPPRKKKALGTSKGHRPQYKRVIVTIRSDEKIPTFEEKQEKEEKK